MNEKRRRERQKKIAEREKERKLTEESLLAVLEFAKCQRLTVISAVLKELIALEGEPAPAIAGLLLEGMENDIDHLNMAIGHLRAMDDGLLL